MWQIMSSTSADIVQDPHFESGIVKFQPEKLSKISDNERVAVEHLKKPDDGCRVGRGGGEDDVGGSPSLSQIIFVPMRGSASMGMIEMISKTRWFLLIVNNYCRLDPGIGCQRGEAVEYCKLHNC
jgi:hypothetical protein